MRNSTAAPSLFSLSVARRQPASPSANMWVMVVTGTILLGGIFVLDRVAERVARKESVPVWMSTDNEASLLFRQSLARDTIMRRLASLPNAPRLQLLAQEEVKPTVQYGDLALRSLNDSVASGRVIAVFERAGWDSVGGVIPLRRRSFSIVPSALDGRTCVTWIPVPFGNSRPEWAYAKLRLDNSEGPCHIIAAFGLPSPERMAWLDARNWAPTLGFQSRSFRYNYYYGDLPRRDPDPGAKWIARAFENTYFRSLTNGRAASGRAVRCIGGDDPACTALVFSSGPEFPVAGADAPPTRLPGVVGGTDADWLAWGTAGHMLRTYGVEKFRTWWTSADTTEAGFKAAFGESVAQFARARVMRSSPARLYVPAIRLVDVLPTLVMVAMCVAWLAFPAPRDANV